MATVTITITDVPEAGGITLQLGSDPAPDPKIDKTLTPAQILGLTSIQRLQNLLAEKGAVKTDFSNLPN